MPNIIEMIIGDINGCNRQINNCSSISEGIALAKQAQQLVKILVDLGSADERIPYLKRETDQLTQQFVEYTIMLEKAIKSAEDHPHWPAEAWKISANIRKRFLHDPMVQELVRHLKFYLILRNLGILVLFVMGMAAVAILIWAGKNWISLRMPFLRMNPR